MPSGKISGGLKDIFSAALVGSARKVYEGSNRAQLFAAIMLPFVIVIALAAARVFKFFADEAFPEVLNTLAVVDFLVGFVLLIGAFAACFLWVKTGGFGLFE